MTDHTSTDETIAGLKRELAELSGLALATGVILTQLIQTNCKRDLNPQASAGKIMKEARDAIEAFATESGADPVMKARALGAVQQYEDQVRSVLNV
jgi:hypothetical protein